jgi:3-oxosteroid 1-dehydrogenase
MNLPATADAVIVGSGCGGLVAAITLKAGGLDPILIEKTSYVGGTTALAIGALWFPANPVMLEAGLEDSIEDGLIHAEAVVGDQGPAASRARQEAYMRGGQRYVRFITDQGVPLKLVPDYPDYYPALPGSRLAGRILISESLDARRLGTWQSLVRPRPPVPGGLVVDSVPQFRAMLAAGYSREAQREVARVVWQSVRLRLKGVKPLVFGQAYVGWLMLVAQRLGVRIVTQTALEELIVEDGGVAGVTARRDGQRVPIRARQGVLLSAGGFARNLAMRNEHGPWPASTAWTVVAEGDAGIALAATAELGVATAGLDRVYWLPGIIGKDGQATIFMAERHVPHSILVDASGSRFTNEAKSYTELGNDIYERHRTVPAIPTWLVVDARHRRRYMLGECPPRLTSRKWLASGHLKRAGALRDLAGQCGIDADGLERTVARFNRMAEAGVDEDFGRGSGLYDLVYADHTHGPNPSLGPISKPPFYAAKVVPTDIGMAGGLLTDEYARVMAQTGAPIDGLYASGTSAASCFGNVYIGGGISLGQSSVFGMIAAEQMLARARATADAPAGAAA